MAATAADARTVDELVSVIRDGGQPKYLLFWGHQPEPEGGAGKGCLSQWWPAAFTVDGVAYPSAEHYMMAAKARLSGDAEAAAQILAAPHPGAAKALGRQVRGFDEQRWAEHRFEVVVAGNMAKFGQHPRLRGAPHASGSAPLRRHAEGRFTRACADRQVVTEAPVPSLALRFRTDVTAMT